MTDLTELITIRAIEQSDVHFILDSTMNSLAKYTESLFKGMNRTNIYKHLELLGLYTLNRIDKSTKRPTYSVFVAVHKDNSDDILSYIVADPAENHVLYQYTKYAYRKLGIQKHMLLPLVVDESQPITVNWPTKEMLKLAKAGRVEIVNKLLEKLIKDTL